MSPCHLHAIHLQLTFGRTLLNALLILFKLSPEPIALNEAISVGGNHSTKFLVLLNEVVKIEMLLGLTNGAQRATLVEELAVEGTDEV